MLKDDFQYYLDHQSELVEKYNGKFLVIKDKKIIGVYDNQEQAYFESKKQHRLGTFLIQRCSPGTEDYTQVFHSRVAFA